MDRVERTREILDELRQLWGVDNPWRVSLAIFPPQNIYDALDTPECWYADGTIAVKRFSAGEHAEFGVHRP